MKKLFFLLAAVIIIISNTNISNSAHLLAEDEVITSGTLTIQSTNV